MFGLVECDLTPVPKAYISSFDSALLVALILLHWFFSFLFFFFFLLNLIPVPKTYISSFYSDKINIPEFNKRGRHIHTLAIRYPNIN
jgi:hypothetical protein